MKNVLPLPHSPNSPIETGGFTSFAANTEQSLLTSSVMSRRSAPEASSDRNPAISGSNGWSESGPEGWVMGSGAGCGTRGVELRRVEVFRLDFDTRFPISSLAIGKVGETVRGLDKER